MTSYLVNRWFFPIVVLAVLAAVLLVSACGGNSFDANRLGGPYDIAYDKVDEKLADFAFYEANGLSLSKAEELDRYLFEDSIRENRKASYGDVAQLYNFAVNSDGKVMVAVWNASNLLPTNVPIQTNVPTFGTKPGLCMAQTPMPTAAAKGTVKGDVMINWFPEDPRRRLPQATGTPIRTPQSPCWLLPPHPTPTPTGTPTTGLLDAISKHFMLAQGKGKSIADFKNSKGNWANKTVVYAGEIYVDTLKCVYTVNNGSGTYQPGGGGRIDQELARLFKEGTGVRPAKVNGHPVNIEGRTTIPGCTPATATATPS